MKDALLTGLAEILETPAVAPETHLADVGSWDSLAIVSTIALLDEHGVEATGQQLAGCVTVADVMKLAGL